MQKADEIRGLRRGVGVWRVGVVSDFVWGTIAGRMESAYECVCGNGAMPKWMWSEMIGSDKVFI